MKKRSSARSQKIDQLAERIKHLQSLYGALRREYYVTIGERVDAMIDRATLHEIRDVVLKIRAKYFQGIDDTLLRDETQKEVKEETKDE